MGESETRTRLNDKDLVSIFLIVMTLVMAQVIYSTFYNYFTNAKTAITLSYGSFLAGLFTVALLLIILSLLRLRREPKPAKPPKASKRFGYFLIACGLFLTIPGIIGLLVQYFIGNVLSAQPRDFYVAVVLGGFAFLVAGLVELRFVMLNEKIDRLLEDNKNRSAQ
jgi:hypothetical protein